MNRTTLVTAIVLRHHPMKEADKILVLATREEGLKRVVAKGLRKGTSRVGGRLEPLRESQILLARGRAMDIVTQVDSLRTFAGVSSDYDALAAGLAAAELLLAFLAEGDPQPEIYDLFATLLGELCQQSGQGEAARLLLVVFELQLLVLLGYQPALDACQACDRPLTSPSDAHGLHIKGGGVICSHCQGLVSGRVHRFAPGAWQLLDGLQALALAHWREVVTTPEAVANCLQILAEYLAFRAEKELKAQRMFDWQPPTPECMVEGGR